MSDKPRIVVITGPTASGKTRVSLDLAHACETRGMAPAVISMDSMQVYRHMDIGTDKLAKDKREGVPHYMIDVADPDRTFSAAEFAKRAGEIIVRTAQEGGAPLLAGGTGFYLRALRDGLFKGPAAQSEIRERLEREIDEAGTVALHDRLRGIDPDSALRIHPNDRVRIIRALEVYETTGMPMSRHFEMQEQSEPRYHMLVIGLDMERAAMYERINQRVVQMIEEGLIDEVKRLRDMGYGPELASQQALGYKQVHMMLDGQIDRERAVYLIQRDTRHYARRQLTWLRKEPGLVWMDVKDRDAIVSRAMKFMEGVA